jgi:hypothetical protein
MRPVVPNLHVRSPGAAVRAALAALVLMLMTLFVAHGALFSKPSCGHGVYENKPLCGGGD